MARSKAKDDDKHGKQAENETENPEAVENVEDAPKIADQNTLLGDVPTASENVIDGHKKTEKVNKNKNIGLKDSGGTVFDPEIHAVDDNGDPVLTPKRQRFKKKRGVKPSITPQAVDSTDKKLTPGQLAPGEKAAVNIAGAGAAGLTVTLFSLIGGEDFAPTVEKNPMTGVNDMEMLTNAYANYFAATGKRDLPPGLALVASIMIYAAPRFSRPKAQSRLKKIGQYFASLFGRKKGSKVPEILKKKEE